jgi:hypothetical protein
LGIGVSLLAAFCIWIASYQIGLYQNLKYTTMSSSKKASLHFQQLILSPLVGIIETFPAFFAIIEFYFLKRTAKEFDVIAK